MSKDDEAPLELAGIPPDRLQLWMIFGVGQVKNDLEQTGGMRVVGGHAEIRQQAWRWVHYEEAKRLRRPG